MEVQCTSSETLLIGEMLQMTPLTMLMQVKTFLTIVEAYILNAATDLYQMKSLSDHPVDPSLFSNTDCNNPSEILIKASEKVVSRFVDIFENMNRYCKTDGVHCYTCEAISLGLL